MFIKSIRIENYKSFRDSGVIELTPGFNVIVGENNSGKTALSLALSFRNGKDFHMSPLTKPQRDFEPPNQMSRVTLECEIEAEEVLQVIRMQPQANHTIAANPNIDPTEQFELFKQRLKSNLGMTIMFYSDNSLQAEFEAPLRSEPGSEYGLSIRLDENESQVLIHQGYSIVDQYRRNTLAHHVGSRLVKRIYAFDAERLNISQSDIHPTMELKPNAANLPAVLHNLMAHRVRFARFVELVRRVFPTIKDISVPLVANTANRTIIQIWNTEPVTERDDLAIGLDKCGTGIGQVLAILYVLVMAETPRPFIIDEPQSFLHPGAVRRLFEIMHEHPQHQYIITTHSPSAIAAARPHNVLLVTKDGYESHVKQIDIKKNSEAQSVLAAVGARLSDVFGADNVLWVEGPTEEQCFPLIATQIAKQPLMGTAILAVLHTGDFESPDSDKTLRLYKKLSNSTGLMPPALAFVFDREERTDKAIDDIQRGGKAQGIAFHFLRRKLYENYLLEPEALYYLISTLDGFSEAPISIQDIENWISRNKWKKKYFGRAVSEKQQTADYWIAHVHGANLLDDLFKQLSDNRYTYYDYKIEYGRILTEWLIENKPEALQEIADLLKDILSRKDKRNPIAE